MISPLIFKLNGKTLRVEKKKYRQNKFNDDVAYILGRYNPYVYPYLGKIDDPDKIKHPGIYIIDNNVYIERPYTIEDKAKYSIKNIIELTPESIFKNLDDADYIELSGTNSPIYGDNDIFRPCITDSDDLALAGMKFAISNKNINFNSYSSKFTDQATKNNGRRALTHGTSLKMDMLSRFANIFDIGVALVFFDKEDCSNPMDPEYNNAYIIFDSDPIDLSKKKLIEITSDNFRYNDEKDGY